MNPTEALHRACKQSLELDRARTDAIRNGDWSRAWDLTDAIDRCNEVVRKALAPAMNPPTLTMAEAARLLGQEAA